MEMVDDQKYPHIPPKYRVNTRLQHGVSLGCREDQVHREREKIKKGADVNVWDKWSEEMQGLLRTRHLGHSSSV